MERSNILTNTLANLCSNSFDVGLSGNLLRRLCGIPLPSVWCADWELESDSAAILTMEKLLSRPLICMIACIVSHNTQEDSNLHLNMQFYSKMCNPLRFLQHLHICHFILA